jgi:hypothetical protein
MAFSCANSYEDLLDAFKDPTVKELFWEGTCCSGCGKTLGTHPKSGATAAAAAVAPTAAGASAAAASASSAATPPNGVTIHFNPNIVNHNNQEIVYGPPPDLFVGPVMTPELREQERVAVAKVCKANNIPAAKTET